MKNVIILDYQLGNLFSVQQACNKVGIQAETSHDRNKIDTCDAIIIPGVGAFIEAMDNLDRLELIHPLNNFVAKGKPLFGICLGQQLLFTESEEFGSRQGLNYIQGVIRKFPNETQMNNKIKVPQIGWNQINEVESSRWRNTPLEGIENGSFMYFVHSYYVIPESSKNVLATTNYEGIDYCSSSICPPNIFATQFHPEKSGEKGLSIYKNWAIQNNLI